MRTSSILKAFSVISSFLCLLFYFSSSNTHTMGEFILSRGAAIAFLLISVVLIIFTIFSVIKERKARKDQSLMESQTNQLSMKPQTNQSSIEPQADQLSTGSQVDSSSRKVGFIMIIILGFSSSPIIVFTSIYLFMLIRSLSILEFSNLKNLWPGLIFLSFLLLIILKIREIKRFDYTTRKISVIRILFGSIFFAIFSVFIFVIFGFSGTSFFKSMLFFSGGASFVAWILAFSFHLNLEGKTTKNSSPKSE